MKQQLALQQAQAQAAAAQAQLPPVDPSATPTSSVDPSQTSAPPQRRDTRALEARGKIANLATLADHVNHGLNAAMKYVIFFLVYVIPILTDGRLLLSVRIIRLR